MNSTEFSKSNPSQYDMPESMEFEDEVQNETAISKVPYIPLPGTVTVPGTARRNRLHTLAYTVPHSPSTSPIRQPLPLPVFNTAAPTAPVVPGTNHQARLQSVPPTPTPARRTITAVHRRQFERTSCLLYTSDAADE